MSTVKTPSSSTALAKPGETKAMLQLGQDQVIMRLDDEGLVKSTRILVKLHFGTDLYAASRGVPADHEKVMPFQPGYMKMVFAAGGTLVVPPVVVNADGVRSDNPKVNYAGKTRIIESVEATALCVMPNPLTGRPVVSVQTIVVDCATVLRQALMKIQSTEVVQILSPEDAAEMKAAGGLKGWICVPLSPFADIWADATKAAVREAMGTYTQQSATARQRACSKAERLACDHNPVTRRTWTYGDLLAQRRKDGSIIENAPRYIEVPMVSFQALPAGELEALQNRLHSMSRAGTADVVSSVADASWEEDDIDNEPEEYGQPEPLALPAPPIDIPVEQEKKPEPVRQERPPVARPREQAPNTARTPIASSGTKPMNDMQKARLIELETLYDSEKGDGAAEDLRDARGFPKGALTFIEARNLIDLHESLGGEG